MGPNEWENLVKFMGPNEWENPQKQWTLANPNGRILIENLEMYLPTWGVLFWPIFLCKKLARIVFKNSFPHIQSLFKIW